VGGENRLRKGGRLQRVHDVINKEVEIYLPPFTFLSKLGRGDKRIRQGNNRGIKIYERWICGVDRLVGVYPFGGGLLSGAGGQLPED
jgi:hypothetical protein